MSTGGRQPLPSPLWPSLCISGTTNPPDLAGVTALNISNAWDLDNSLAVRVLSLPHLQLVNLSGCKKLTTGFTDMLAREGVHGAVLSLSVQRCFQLNAGSLSSLLSLQLQFLAMSHLDLTAWPASRTAQGEEGISIGSASTSSPNTVRGVTCGLPSQTPSQLARLALNNCQLSGASLAAISMGCPSLQQLFLGGSSFTSTTHSAQQYSPSAEYLQLCDEVRVMVSGGEGERPRQTPDAAVHLGALGLSLKSLQLLELTFWPRGIISRVGEALGARSSSAEVWDLSQAPGVAAAHHMLHAAHSRSSGAPTLQPASLQLACQSAVRCSSHTRDTALHTAVMRGDASSIRLLLELGASMDARGKGGASPLFLACDLGLTACVEVLVEAGADVQV